MNKWERSSAISQLHAYASHFSPCSGTAQFNSGFINTNNVQQDIKLDYQRWIVFSASSMTQLPYGPSWNYLSRSILTQPSGSVSPLKKIKTITYIVIDSTLDQQLSVYTPHFYYNYLLNKIYIRPCRYLFHDMQYYATIKKIYQWHIS